MSLTFQRYSIDDFVSTSFATLYEDYLCIIETTTGETITLTYKGWLQWFFDDGVEVYFDEDVLFVTPLKVPAKTFNEYNKKISKIDYKA